MEKTDAVEIINLTWFDRIGIVLIKNKNGEHKAYIKKVDGINLAYDTDELIKWGTAFPLNVAYELFNIPINDRQQ